MITLPHYITMPTAPRHLQSLQSALSFLTQEMIKSKELIDMETAQVMITLPHYIKMPTPKWIEELFELISSPAVTVNPVIKSNAYIAFATIVRKACFPSAKPRAVFPRMLVGDVCDPNDVRITEKYIPYLVA